MKRNLMIYICILIVSILVLTSCSNRLDISISEDGYLIIDGIETEYDVVQDGTNRNLLINGNFVVNQRGKQQYYGSDIYTVDRWKITGNTALSVTPLSNGNGILIDNDNVNNGYYGQYLELSEIRLDINVTISASINGKLIVESCKTPSKISNCEDNTFFINKNNVQFGYFEEKQAWYVGVIVEPNTSVEINYVKLEEGKISTAPYGISDNIELELIKCQRYYKIYSQATPLVMIRYDERYAKNENYLVISVWLGEEMYKKPTLVYYNDTTWFMAEGIFYWYNLNKMELLSLEKDRFQILIYTGIKYEQLNGTVGISETVRIALDAEI